MLGCMKIKKVSQDKIKFNFKIKNDKLKFLILIREEDMVKKFYMCNYTLRDFLLANKKKLPGDLSVINFDDIEKEDVMKNYIIEGNPIPNELYIKLESTNIYVPANTYELKYFQARQNELKNIFITLGAKSIKCCIKQSNTKNTVINASAGIENIAVDIGNEASYSNEKTVSTQESSLLIFDYNEKINEINYKTFTDDENNNFYFLPKEKEWQNIIIRRLDHSQLTDKCILKNNSNVKMSVSLKSNLKKANIGFGHSTENVDEFEMFYEIEYHPLASLRKNSFLIEIPSFDDDGISTDNIVSFEDNKI
jgi:hypothetical protein